jgi:hypothetical protein
MLSLLNQVTQLLYVVERGDTGKLLPLGLGEAAQTERHVMMCHPPKENLKNESK